LLQVWSVLEEPTANQITLAVFPPGEDRTSLDNILDHSEWQLQFACSLEETQTALRAFPFTPENVSGLWKRAASGGL
jgi:hypothetical protein